MNMKRNNVFVAIVLLLSATSCEQLSQNGEIYGVVSDRGFDGQPVPVVNLTLAPSGKSTVTGTDGRYIFTDVPPGDSYSIHFSKQGYKDGDKNNISVISQGRTQCDIQIEMLIEGVDIDKKELDFGLNSQNNTLSFNFQNKYNQTLTYEIVHNCGWISSITPQSGNLSYTSVASVVVVIDRELLSLGENTTKIIIRTSLGSYDLNVRAVKLSNRLPALNTLDVTDIHSSTAVLKGQIIDIGEPRYTKRGFIYSELSSPTPDNSKEVTAIISDEDIFSCGIDGLVLGKSYYVKAFAVNSEGTAYSSNTVKFTTQSVSPQIETLEPINIDEENNAIVLRGNVIYAGDPEYSEIGFAYSNVYQNPTIEDGKIAVAGFSGTGIFEKRIVLQGPLHEYYVRSYALSVNGEVYGESVKISPTEYYNIPSANLSVQKKDIGCGTWESMNNLCKNSTVGGFTDWRLPTKEELATLFNLREEIGGFEGSGYWSSSFNGSYRYIINFSSGSLSSYYAGNEFHARCVRTINQNE